MLNIALANQLKTELSTTYKGNVDMLLQDVRTAVQSDTVRDALYKGEKPVFIEGIALKKEYTVGDQVVHALRGVDLSIAEGEFVSIVGTSGSGKSTLLHIIGGLDQPSDGEMRVGGESLQKKSDRELASYRNTTIGFVFQFFYLQPYLTVLQNVEIPLAFRGVRHADRVDAAKQALDAVGLMDRLEHKPSELSGGQMQRVAIARALASEPKMLLADEPTGNLDQKTSAEIMALLQDVNDRLGVTLVMVTHDMAVAQQADRMIEISDGAFVV